MCGVSWACSLAGRFSMPVLLRNRRLADGAGSVAMQPVSASNIGDGGDDLRGTRKPLRLWFQAMWYVTNQKHGVSALGLQRILGLGSYQTAWAWLHKLRRAMVRPGRDLLGGAVEVDETYVGGRETGVVGRQTKTKSIVAIAAEVRGRGTGRIRMSRVEDVAARSLIPFVQTTVAPGATVRTDGWSAYSGLANQGYDHQPRSISASGDPAHIVMPRVHRVTALLDRWWLGIHHGAIDADHLDYYLDEFTFRFNRRRSQARGLLFFRLLQQAVQHEPVPLQGPSRRSSQPRKPNVGDTRAKWIPSLGDTGAACAKAPSTPRVPAARPAAAMTAAAIDKVEFRVIAVLLWWCLRRRPCGCPVPSNTPRAGAPWRHRSRTRRPRRRRR